MDDLDRVFHRLVSNIRHRFPEYLTLPFTVQELYESLIPYRHHRRELGIETNQDYEIAMTRLLSGERDYLQADQSMREKLKSELEAAHGDPGAFREFANAKVSLAPEALRRIRALTASPPQSDTPAAPRTATVPAMSESEREIARQQEAELRASIETPTSTPRVGDGPNGSSKMPASTAGTPPAGTASPSGGFSATFPVTAPQGAGRQSTSGMPSAAGHSVPEGCRFCGGSLPEGRTVIYCPHCGNNLSVSRCPACGSELEKGWKFCATCGRSVG
ncbi:MAG TPA: zinc ribbon domain-containing protein [Gemmatimonadaceae bacterium]|nr:zinc ribbon domain-containing protein [Gemmatimonadaceae bacterium]